MGIPSVIARAKPEAISQLSEIASSQQTLLAMTDDKVYFKLLFPQHPWTDFVQVGPGIRYLFPQNMLRHITSKEYAQYRKTPSKMIVLMKAIKTVRL